MKKKVTIVDCGSGNIFSAQQSFIKVSEDNKLNVDVVVSNNPEDLNTSSHIILPGQGAFGSCMQGLLKIPKMIDRLNNAVLENKTPFLGICVGMQLVADISYENGKHYGLGWIQGKIKKIPGNQLKLPHMGWNEVLVKNSKNKLIDSNTIKDYYFVHSFYFDCENEQNVMGTTKYGINFASFINLENIYGVQFHPEKSSLQGLNLIKNFLKL